MKNILVAAVIFLAIAGWSGAGACQGESSDDSAIEQEESQVSSGLSSEISSEASQSEAEVSQVDSSMSISGN